MAHHSTEAVAGLVLAGGLSRRMGRDKAGMQVSGETLLERQVRLLRECGVEECWVSVRKGGTGVEAGIRWVEDVVEEGGPMEGIRQVLTQSQAVHLLVLAVDLPGLTADFLGRLLARRRVGVGVVPVGGNAGGLEPLCAIYPVARGREAVGGWAGAGERSPRRMASEGLAEGWMREWLLEDGDLGCLVNWNRPEDWRG